MTAAEVVGERTVSLGFNGSRAASFVLRVRFSSNATLQVKDVDPSNAVSSRFFANLRHLQLAAEMFVVRIPDKHAYVNNLTFGKD